MASVIVRKSDNMVIDASDGVLNYNTVDYENMHPAVNPIPVGDNPKKYMKDGNGDIVKRPSADLIASFEDEKMAAVKVEWANVIAGIPDNAPWKAPMILVGQYLGFE